nr:MAG: ORF1 [Torque teno virus]
MAWGWWWKRRAFRPRRRWRTRRRRRRLRPRRARRTFRRPRRRVRRRRWGRRRYKRGWRRRTYTRRARRKRRKRLVLTQWHPAVRRKCRITGYLPIVWCGHGRASFNYAWHSDDYVKQPDSFGGSFSTMTFNLKVLFDENQRGLNRWTYSNEQLDLARYKGCRLTFYRSKDTDFIVQYDINEPFALDKYSSASYHPAKMMMAKNKILIPSYDTRPKGRQKISVRVPPPKLFTDKWYAQSDLCKVNLLALTATAASFLHPFGSPQTANICATFQVLRDPYYKAIGFSSSKHTEVQDWLFNEPSFWQSNIARWFLENVRNPQKLNQAPENNEVSQDKGWNINIQTQKDSNYNWYPLNPKCNASHTNNITNIKTAAKIYWQWITTNSPQITNTDLGMTHAWTNATIPQYEYHLGIFSPIFIGPTRAQTKFSTAYVDVTYNPLLDKGVGNMVWFQYTSKADTQFVAGACKCVLEGIPLYAALHGYSDFIQMEIGKGQDTQETGLVCIICRYTDPPMYNEQHPTMGYVPYNTNFGNGKWIDGKGHIPLYWLQRWRPALMFQTDVFRDIVETGPFSYKDTLTHSSLVMKYSFYFTWGGDQIFQQTIKNPCKDDSTGTSRQPREVQVTDPQLVGPRYVFHYWDWRRGYLSERALKRLYEKPLDYDEYPKKPKRPRIFPPTTGELQSQQHEEDSCSEEENSSPCIEETPQTKIQRQLRQQLKQQQRLGDQLRLVQQQLLKTQAGLHINPLLSIQA